MRTRTLFLFVATLMLMATRAQAVSDADKCEAAKNKVAGKYAFCRQTAEAKAVKSGGAPDFSKCDPKFSDKWTQAETKASGMCPTTGDEAAMQGFITTHANTVAAALSGAGLPRCGDNSINVAGEQCDGTDLGGESCTTLGFSGGTLSCSSCAFDTNGCTCGGGSGELPETGQTQCDQGAGTLGACPGSPAGQDGAVLAGAGRSYTDNGDGTITDNVTGLMWEKLSGDGSIHSAVTIYSWYTAFTTKIATLNGGSFAGHSDWRMPNVDELQSLADYGRGNPAIDPAFNSSCVPSCTVFTCSCTQLNSYWSSTTYQNSPGLAWLVYFPDGAVGHNYKSTALYVRAVRGGL